MNKSMASKTDMAPATKQPTKTSFNVEEAINGFVVRKETQKNGNWNTETIIAKTLDEVTTIIKKGK